MTKPLFADFLGMWILDPSSCSYEQGETPVSGSCLIEENDGVLSFTVTWTDSAGERQSHVLTGTPNGKPAEFNGGDLVDALSIEPVSETELNSVGFYRGTERMIAQRQLDSTRQAMRITQQVRLPDGTCPANVAIYRRQVLN